MLAAEKSLFLKHTLRRKRAKVHFQSTHSLVHARPHTCASRAQLLEVWKIETILQRKNRPTCYFEEEPTRFTRVKREELLLKVLFRTENPRVSFIYYFRFPPVISLLFFILIDSFVVAYTFDIWNIHSVDKYKCRADEIEMDKEWYRIP